MISATGFWIGHEVGHYHDEGLAAAMTHFFQGQSVIDLGCGDGWYVGRFLEAGIDAIGVDGNPDTSSWPAAAHSKILVADLTASPELPRASWALSLEVGEHIPPEHESAFLDALDACSSVGVVLSWAVPGQGGHGHVNERPNEYVRARMVERGYGSDESVEEMLRKSAQIQWFQKTLMVFRRH